MATSQEPPRRHGHAPLGAAEPPVVMAPSRRLAVGVDQASLADGLLGRQPDRDPLHVDELPDRDRRSGGFENEAGRGIDCVVVPRPVICSLRVR